MKESAYIFKANRLLASYDYLLSRAVVQLQQLILDCLAVALLSKEMSIEVLDDYLSGILFKTRR